jgi:hypothetical protein
VNARRQEKDFMAIRQIMITCPTGEARRSRFAGPSNTRHTLAPHDRRQRYLTKPVFTNTGGRAA